MRILDTRLTQREWDTVLDALEMRIRQCKETIEFLEKSDQKTEAFELLKAFKVIKKNAEMLYDKLIGETQS